MARITVTFKGIPLHTVETNPDVTRIGRDPANDVHIDSLAVAEFHAEVSFTAEGYRIQSLAEGGPLAVNDKPVEETLLRSGDEIRVGKHVLFFTDDSEPRQALPHPARKVEQEPFRPFEGSFQVLSGQRIGMVIPLKATVTRIGKEATGMVVVTREETGFSIAVATDNVRLTINGREVGRGEAPLLSSGDMVRINNAQLQYFQH